MIGLNLVMKQNNELKHGGKNYNRREIVAKDKLDFNLTDLKNVIDNMNAWKNDNDLKPCCEEEFAKLLHKRCERLTLFYFQTRGP